jgi:transcriptional regulator with XRE-family HTH domain
LLAKDTKVFNDTRMCVNKFFRFPEFPGMEQSEKEYTKLKLATCIRKILKDNRLTSTQNQNKGIEDLSLVDSMRQVGASSGLSFTIIQETSAGKRDPQFTSLISLIEALGISFTKFAGIYDKITDVEIEEIKRDIEAKRKKDNSKKS